MIVYSVFLFLVVVVLLNLLIAQMSDTYGSVQQDAQRSLAINRAWIVARVEHNSLLARVSTSNVLNVESSMGDLIFKLRISENTSTKVAKS